MAKKQSSNGDVKDDYEEEVEGRDFIITSRKKRIDLFGVSPTLLQQLQSKGTLPEVPYREIETAFGEKQKDPLTAEDLQNDEEKAAWQKYISARDDVLGTRSNDFIRAIFAKGTDIDETQIEQWKDERVNDWGLEIPQRGIDLKIKYIQDELLGSQEDIVNIVAGVLAKTGAPKEAVEEARQMFRRSLR